MTGGTSLSTALDSLKLSPGFIWQCPRGILSHVCFLTTCFLVLKLSVRLCVLVASNPEATPGQARGEPGIHAVPVFIVKDLATWISYVARRYFFSPPRSLFLFWVTLYYNLSLKIVGSLAHSSGDQAVAAAAGHLDRNITLSARSFPRQNLDC